MTEFIAYDPRVEVNGQTILSVVEGIPEYKEFALGVLEKNGIRRIRRGSWHSQQGWLNAFKDIAEEIGGFTLYAIGRNIPDSADWPPMIETLEDALASIDIAYHMNHRIEGRRLYDAAAGTMTDGIGHYGFRKVSEHLVQMACDTPYPCDFNKGIIAATANKFKEAAEIVSIREEGECRKRGADGCTYIIRW